MEGEKLRRSSVKDTNTRNRPCVAKATYLSCILRPVRVKPSLPSARSVFVVEGVHKIVSNGKNFAQQVCGNQNPVSFADATPLRKNTSRQDTAARLIVSSMMGLTIVSCGYF